MAEHGDSPTDEELIRFAAEGVGPILDDEETLRTSVREARELWLLLYRTSEDGGAPRKPRD